MLQKLSEFYFGNAHCVVVTLVMRLQRELMPAAHVTTNDIKKMKSRKLICVFCQPRAELGHAALVGLWKARRWIFHRLRLAVIIN